MDTITNFLFFVFWLWNCHRLPSEIKYGAQIMTVIEGVSRACESPMGFPTAVTEQASPWQPCVWEQASPRRTLKTLGHLRFPSWTMGHIQCNSWPPRGFSSPRKPAQGQQWTLGHLKLLAWNNMLGKKNLWETTFKCCVLCQKSDASILLC